MATVDAFGMIITRLSPIYILIQREASVLLFLLQWAMREPLQVVRATGTGFHAFLLLYLPQFGKSIGQRQNNEKNFISHCFAVYIMDGRS